jgi:hypothetical protein
MMMKKFLLLALASIIMVGCPDEKTFQKADGTTFTAEPYGWMNTSKKIDGVVYDVNPGNIVWSIVLGETVVAPVLFTGLALWEPVDYVEPKQTL